MTRRQGRRRKKLLDDFKDRRGYCELKEEALDRTMWRNRFTRGFGPVVWQIIDDDEKLGEYFVAMFYSERLWRLGNLRLLLKNVLLILFCAVGAQQKA